MRRNLTKNERIRKRTEFESIFRTGTKKEYCGIKLIIKKNCLLINRIGVIIKQGVKKAVQRNREKRLVLEAYRYLKPRIIQGNDFVVIVKQYESHYSERVHQLEFLFHLLNLFKR